MFNFQPQSRKIVNYVSKNEWINSLNISMTSQKKVFERERERFLCKYFQPRSFKMQLTLCLQQQQTLSTENKKQKQKLSARQAEKRKILQLEKCFFNIIVRDEILSFLIYLRYQIKSICLQTASFRVPQQTVCLLRTWRTSSLLLL